MQDGDNAARRRLSCVGQSDKVTSLRHRRMFRGEQKGKGRALWETDPTSPTLPFKERTASSLIPSCLWQRRIKTLPRM